MRSPFSTDDQEHHAMAVAKRFQASTQETRDRPPVPIVLEGFYARGHVPNGSDGRWELELQAMGAPPLGAIDALRDATIVDQRTGRSVFNPGALMAFFYAVLEPESVAAFHSLVEDRTRLVELIALSEVMEFLSEHYTGGPTGAPSPSGTGGAPSGDGAPAGSSWPGGTFPPPPPQQ